MDEYDGQGQPSQALEGTCSSRDYIRFAALGDSASCGVGDPTPEGWRGWAQILADSIAVDHDVSFCKLAVPGATVADVRGQQLPGALAHRPVIASLVVGVNDVMRSSWDPEKIRDDLMFCARELAHAGVLIITVRFHDHSRVLGLPELIARPMRRRIELLNTIYDEVHEAYGSLRVDLSDDPSILDRCLWASDRMHPSELGHRRLARRVGGILVEEGLSFHLPSVTCTNHQDGTGASLHTLLLEVAWVASRLRDLGPTALRRMVRRPRRRRVAQRLSVDG